MREGTFEYTERGLELAQRRLVNVYLAQHRAVALQLGGNFGVKRRDRRVARKVAL